MAQRVERAVLFIVFHLVLGALVACAQPYALCISLVLLRLPSVVRLVRLR